MDNKFIVLIIILALVLIGACSVMSKPQVIQDTVTSEDIGTKSCGFKEDLEIKSLLKQEINFSEENVSNKIIPILEDFELDNIIIKGALVYFTHDNGKANSLYRFDLSTNKIARLIVNTEDRLQSVFNPSIYGKYIVFNDIAESPGPFKSEVKSKIVICNIETGKKQTLDHTEESQFEPWVWDNKIVWKEGSDFSHSLVFYDIKKKEKRKLGLLSEKISRPKFYNDFIVFESFEAESPSVSYYSLLFNAEFAMPSTSSNVKQEHPSIYGDKAVFADNREGNWDIYLYDFNIEQLEKITNNTADQKNPMIYQDMIVWEDYRNENSDIYVYYMKNETEVRISNSTIDKWSPAIFGGLIAWRGGDRMINKHDLYIYPIPKLSYYKEATSITNSTI